MSSEPLNPSSFKILLDTPPKTQLALGHDLYATALQEIITQSDPRFAIGIFGGWGSGKTTLMEAIKARLDEARMVPVWFTAWRYEKEEHLIVPLLDIVREALVEWAAKHEQPNRAMETASTVGKAIRSLLSGFSMKIGLPGAMDLSFDANKALTEAARLRKAERDARVPRSFYHATFRALKEAFGAFIREDPSRRIVVFVDDLDRCMPANALEVLESMKLFFDLDGFVFVVGLDQKVVEMAVEARYAREGTLASMGDSPERRISGADYIKKIFQVPFSLFPVAVTEIDNFLESIIHEANLPPEQREDLRATVRPHLKFLVGDAGMNPREIKRYINAYTLLMKVRPYLDREVLLTLETIRNRLDWEKVQQALLTYRHVFIKQLGMQLAGMEPRALEQLDPELATLPPQFLSYLMEGRPGHPLLGQAQHIDQYIYAGEAIRSRTEFRASDVVRRVTELREPLRGAAMRPNPEALSEAHNQLSQVRSMIGALATRPDAFSQSILRCLEELEQNVDQLPPGGSELANTWAEKGGRETWLKTADTLIRRVVSSVLQWSRE
jgi:hypothetical protein